VFGLHHLWCGNHWQPVPCDLKENTLETQNKLSSKGTHHHGGVPNNISAIDGTAVGKDVTDVSKSDSGACGLASLQTQPANSDRNVLLHYTRNMECEEKLVKLFDGTRTLTAKEDLLHSLR